MLLILLLRQNRLTAATVFLPETLRFLRRFKTDELRLKNVGGGLAFPI